MELACTESVTTNGLPCLFTIESTLEMVPAQTGHSGACQSLPEVQFLANDWNRQRPDALLQQDNQGLQVVLSLLLVHVPVVYVYSRSQHPNSPVGKPGFYQGFNTGVLLYNLTRYSATMCN